MAGTPNVRIEGAVFSDLRYEHLGRLIGTTRFDAIGRMAVLWHHCTAHGLHVLSADVVAAVVDPEALIASRLGERSEGGIRIRGTAGRIEWYGALQESGRKSAAKRWSKRGKRTHNKPNGSPNGSPMDHPVGGPKEEEKEEEKEEDSSSGSSSGKGGRGGKGRRRREPAADAPLPSDWTPTPEHVKRAADSGLDLDEQVTRFKAHAETNARQCASWNGAFTTWLLNAPEFAAKRSAVPVRAPPARRGLSAEDIWQQANEQEARERGES